jgi:PEP-CTERM motif
MIGHVTAACPVDLLPEGSSMRANRSLRLTAGAVLATALTAVASAAQKDNGTKGQNNGWERDDQVQDSSWDNNSKDKKDKKDKKDTVAVPEPPSTLLLMGIGLVVLGLTGLRKQRDR